MASVQKQVSTSGRNLIVVLAILLAILHQDFWWWDSDMLIFGFMPIGLAYHALYSVVAACLWGLAILIAWPYHLEAMANETHRTTQGFDIEEAQDADGVGEF